MYCMRFLFDQNQEQLGKKKQKKKLNYVGMLQYSSPIQQPDIPLVIYSFSRCW